MGPQANLESSPIPTRPAPTLNGNLNSHEETKTVTPGSTDSVSKPGGAPPLTAPKPLRAPQFQERPVKGVDTNDQIASTLAAASEKLAAAHKKQKKEMRCWASLNPARWLAKMRDLYINTCMMAADNAELGGANPGMYADAILSRNVSQRRDIEHNEILQASMSRQVSISLSRQQSHAGGGLNRQQSLTGGGLNRQTSVAGGFSRQGSQVSGGLNRQQYLATAGLNRQQSVTAGGLNPKVIRNASGRTLLTRNTSVGLAPHAPFNSNFTRNTSKASPAGIQLTGTGRNPPTGIVGVNR